MGKRWEKTVVACLEGGKKCQLHGLLYLGHLAALCGPISNKCVLLLATVATPFAEQYVHDVNPIVTKMRPIACSATRTFNPYRCAGMSFSLGKGAAKIGHDAPLFSRQKCSV